MNDPWSRWADEPESESEAEGRATRLSAPVAPPSSPGAEPASLRQRRAQVRDVPAQPRLLVVGPKPEVLNLGGVLRVWGYEVIGPVAPEKARAVAKLERVDVALVDVDVSPVAYDIVWQLNEFDRPCRSVLMGRSIDRGTMREAFLVGVVACLSKPVDLDMLEPALRVAVEGSTLARACIAPRSRWDSTRNRDEEPLSDRLAVLTLREQEVLDLLLRGVSTKSMAETLGITPRTVKYHVTNILSKLGETSRMSLLARLRRDLTQRQR